MRPVTGDGRERPRASRPPKRERGRVARDRAPVRTVRARGVRRARTARGRTPSASSRRCSRACGPRSTDWRTTTRSAPVSPTDGADRGGQRADNRFRRGAGHPQPGPPGPRGRPRPPDLTARPAAARSDRGPGRGHDRRGTGSRAGGRGRTAPGRAHATARTLAPKGHQRPRRAIKTPRSGMTVKNGRYAAGFRRRHRRIPALAAARRRRAGCRVRRRCRCSRRR